MNATSSTFFLILKAWRSSSWIRSLVCIERNECHVERGCGSLYPLRGTTWHWCDLTFIEPSVVKLDYGKVSVIGISSCDSALLVSGAA